MKGRLSSSAAVWLVAAALSGCAPGRPAPTRETPRPTLAPVDSLWFVSARDGRPGADPRHLGDSLLFGVIVTVRRDPADPTEDELPFDVVDSIPLSRERFELLLRTRAEPSFAVLYVHGFGTSADEAWQQAADARTRGQGDEPWIVFTWPAGSSWLAFPREGNLIATAYRLDSASAVASRPAFREALETARAAVPGERLAVLTHSMGAQLVTEALAEPSPTRDALHAAPLRVIAFTAPDIAATRLRDVLMDRIRPLAQRFVLYASSDDRALGASGRLGGTARAGRILEPDSLPLRHPAMESVDVTDGPNASGPFRRAFGARHGIRHASGMAFDLVQLVGPGRAPECRETLGLATRTAPTAWKLNTGPLPPPAAMDRCPVLQGLRAP